MELGNSWQFSSGRQGRARDSRLVQYWRASKLRGARGKDQPGNQLGTDFIDELLIGLDVAVAAKTVEEREIPFGPPGHTLCFSAHGAPQLTARIRLVWEQ